MFGAVQSLFLGVFFGCLLGNLSCIAQVLKSATSRLGHDMTQSHDNIPSPCLQINKCNFF